MNITSKHLVTDYTLELSQEEATFLLCIMRLVGGDPAGNRKIADQFLTQLGAAGIDIDYNTGKAQFPCHGGIYCD